MNRDFPPKVYMVRMKVNDDVIKPQIYLSTLCTAQQITALCTTLFTIKYKINKRLIMSI